MYFARCRRADDLYNMIRHHTNLQRIVVSDEVYSDLWEAHELNSKQWEPRRECVALADLPEGDGTTPVTSELGWTFAGIPLLRDARLAADEIRLDWDEPFKPSSYRSLRR